MQWYSHSEQLYRRVDIYVPEHADGRCLYLIHGINGYEGSWVEKGQAVDTLLAMMATGRCRPMILIMPDCNKWPSKPHPGKSNLWRSVFRYAHLSREHELDSAVCDLMDMIDTTLHAAPVCAIAGLSDGARIACNVAKMRPERVRAIGLFSPVLKREQLPSDFTQAYYIYVGKSDIFKPNGKRFDRRLSKARHPQHYYTELRGNHNWRMWRKCLADFLEQL